MVAAVAIAACAVAFALTFRFSATTPAAMMSGMGAEFFPRLVIAVMVVLAVCIAFGIGSPPMERPAPVPIERLDHCRCSCRFHSRSRTARHVARFIRVDGGARPHVG